MKLLLDRKTGWRRRGRAGAAGLILALAACAGTMRDQTYKADATPVSIARYVASAPQTLSVRSEDGLMLTGYYWPGASNDDDVVIFFHGRGSNQGVGARYAEHLTGRGDHVLVASYRGFGGNPGSPTQAGLMMDGRSFVAKARDLAGPGARVFLVGHSLGGAVALHVAATVPVAGVITLSTFDKLEESAPLGTGLLLPDKWNNLDAVTKIRAPFVMVQGTDDDRVDLAQAEHLFATAGPPAAYILVPGAGHNPQMDLLGPLVSQAVAAIDAGALARYPATLPPGLSVRHK
ncbi:MAG: alpha/beta fold hydrolase [Sphingobium sp.]